MSHSVSVEQQVRSTEENSPRLCPEAVQLIKILATEIVRHWKLEQANEVNASVNESNPTQIPRPK